MNQLWLWGCIATQVLSVLLFAALWSRNRSLAVAVEAARHEIVRLAARTGGLEKQLNEAWSSVEERVGRIHETFESGRACRMGAVVGDVGLKMGQLNRKLDQLLAGEWRREQETGEP